MSVISVRNLSKEFLTFDRREGLWGAVRDLFQRKYQTLKAVDDISFEVEEGELLGYIGPNGAGKSTSIKMLTGILKPTSGDMSVLGYHPFKDRKRYVLNIGVVFGQRTQLWWDIAVIESLNLLSKIYEVDQTVYKQRLEELTEILDLSEILRKPVRKLSLGQRIRSDLAASLIHAPKVLFLDEPTIGLDAMGKASVRGFLRKINRDFKTTIILTTHDLNEIEELCKRILVVDHGKIVFDGKLSTLKTLPGFEKHLKVELNSDVEVGGIFPDGVKVEKENNTTLLVKFDPQKVPTREVVERVMLKLPVHDLTINDPDIEEIIRKIYQDGI